MAFDSGAKHIYLMARRYAKYPECSAKIIASELCGCGHLFLIDMSLLRIFPKPAPQIGQFVIMQKHVGSAEHSVRSLAKFECVESG